MTIRLIVAGLPLALGALCTPPPASVAGFVFDPSGASVAGASVALTGPDGSPLGHTVTGPDGVFRFRGATGVCRIMVRRDGFEPEARDVEIRGGGASVRITLRVAAMRQQVTVSAEAGLLNAVSQFLDQSLVSSAGYSLVGDGVETMGEIVMRGNNVMLGYYKNPEGTAQAFLGGWFHSDDIAVMHPDGYVEIRDRKKDIVISRARTSPRSRWRR